MRLFHEEQFGPVIPVATFRDAAEVDAAVRASWNGQQAAIFTTDATGDVAALKRRVAELEQTVSTWESWYQSQRRQQRHRRHSAMRSPPEELLRTLLLRGTPIVFMAPDCYAENPCPDI